MTLAEASSTDLIQRTSGGLPIFPHFANAQPEEHSCMMARSPSMRGTFKLFAAIACVISVSSCQQASIPKVSDPYRWMEDLKSKAVADWVAAENQVTFAYLAKLPMREHFQRRITELWNYPKVAIPVHEGGRFFYTKNAGLQRQAPLYMRSSLAAPGKLVLDPNTLSPDGSISLAQWQPSHDGRFLAYGLSEGGADWRTVHVRDVLSSSSRSARVTLRAR